MRIIYLIVTSSIMICLMLLVRKFFRKKLSANVIFTLWLILYFRMALPFGYWELPLFGTAAEITYRPMSFAEQLFQDEPENSTPLYEDEYIYEIPESETKRDSEGVKIYDAAVPADLSKDSQQTHTTIHRQPTERAIILIIWLTGSLLVAGYVIFQNRKLHREVDKLDIVDKIVDLDICVSKDFKTPCLLGVRTPKIIVTESVLENPMLYDYAITHELEHYKHKDHIWNAERIFICILYWWHPLVWYAAKCVAEDAELACDERVLKNKSVEECKNYGYALLQMIENVQNKPLHFATSFSGNKKSLKLRIESITNRNATKKYILFPTLFLLMLLLAAGCVYPSEKSYIKTTEWKNGETEEYTYNEASYEFSLQDEFKSMLLYYETYEYGELTERNILSYGDLENLSDQLLLRDESHKYEAKQNFIVEMNGIKISMPALQENTRAYAISHMYCENDLMEITPGDDMILMASFQEKGYEMTHTYSCEVLSSYDEPELKEALGNHNLVVLARLILSDLPSETLCKQMQTKEFPIEGESTNGRMLAESWANAFVQKEAETLLKLATDSVRQQLIDAQILDEDVSIFGWSSPWPGLFTKKCYKIIYSDRNGAEILYYASISTPQVIVWKETLEFNNEQISSWELQTYESISTLNDYRSAYPEKEITDTPLDYYTNGLGEQLNQNALLSSSDAYLPLFDPGTAALELLNISKDYGKIHYTLEETGNETVVYLSFLNSDGSTSMTDVTMWQPYGKEGIWIPK